MEIRVSLSEQTFRDLVAGKVVTIAELTVDGKREKHDLKLALQDIGWSRMYAALDDAYARNERDRG